MNNVIVLVGPTAVGKTEYSIEIAKAFNGEIVSCDSMQLYKYMDIGSAKPTKEEQAQVIHHLIDFVDPGEEFTVALYEKHAKDAMKDIISRGKTPIVTGGTGLYLNSLLYDMDFGSSQKDEQYRNELFELCRQEGPLAVHNILKDEDSEAAERIHPNNVKRVIRALESIKLEGKAQEPFSNVTEKNKDYNYLLICLERDREHLYERINLRVDILIEMGLFEEVKSLMDRGLNSDDISMKGIGYKEIIDYYNGDYDREEAIRLIKRNTRRYAKRQITWFKRYEDMKWFNLDEYSTKQDALEDMIKWLKKSM